MLIETDEIDWHKPIIHMNKSGKITPALLVSKNTKVAGYNGTYNHYYGVILYDKEGDKLVSVKPDGFNTNSERCIFNTDIKNAMGGYDAEIIKDAAKNIKQLGEF